MCGRFGLYAPPDALEARYEVDLAYDYAPRYNVAPGAPIATVRNTDPGTIDRARWGLHPAWIDDGDFPDPINARAETVARKPAFREAFAERRCLVPASNYYEWGGPAGRRVPYAVRVEGQGVFSMAGVWEAWSGGGGTVRSVAIVTTEANDAVAPIHDRMPVVLTREEESRWFGPDELDELHALLDPYPADCTEVYEVSSAVNDPANDGPGLVEPVGGEQSGLGEFG